MFRLYSQPTDGQTVLRCTAQQLCPIPEGQNNNQDYKKTQLNVVVFAFLRVDLEVELNMHYSDLNTGHRFWEH